MGFERNFQNAMDTEVIFYAGTYSERGSKGIYIVRLDLHTGAMRIAGHAGGIRNPSFLAADAAGKHLYAVSETLEFEGEPGGGLHAFAIDGDALRPIHATPTRGADPCYVALSPDGRFVLVSNYTSGSIASFAVREDGGVSEAVSFAQHEGASGVNPVRQEGPHAHCIVPDATGRYAIAADLGQDALRIYRLDERGGLHPGDPPSVDLAPGAGPRHVIFHPDGDRLFAINELGSTVTAFDWDAARGRLAETQTISTLPEGFAGRNDSADLHAHPNGRFLYGSNRGHDSIVVFEIAPDGLRPAQHIHTGGHWPRNFCLYDRFLLVANRRTDRVVVFEIDEATGRLSATGKGLDIPSPACICFA